MLYIMEENVFEDEEPPKTSKAWLDHTDKSLSRLQNVKKTNYRLGGGPKEREVDCQCNYRSKHSSSFVNMDPDPPQISQESQETASNMEMSVPDLVKHQHDKKPKIRYRQPKQKKIPYSAIVCRAQDTPEVPIQEKQQQGHHVKNFIAIKGQNVSPQFRSQSSSSQSVSQQMYKGACLLHLDPQHVEETQKATLEGLRKYSAYGQEDADASFLPNAPRGSPEIPGSPIEFSPPRDEHLLEDSSLEDEFYEDGDEEEDEELKNISQLGKRSSLSSTGSKSLVFEIPTADIEHGSDDEESYRNTPLNASLNDRALSADYIEKSGVFLDELAVKQKQETEELSEMFSEMINDKLKVDDIDLRSVLSTPNTAHQVTNPTPRGGNTGLNVVNIGTDNVLEDQYLDENVSDGMWVEEPYVSRIRNDIMERNLCLGLDRFQSPKRRVQSAKTTRRKEEDGFVLKGKTFELFDARDLAVNRRLSEQRSMSSSAGLGNENVCGGKTNEVLGKPPRPKSAKKPKVQKRHSSAIINSREVPQEGKGPPEHDQKIPRPRPPRNPKKSSLRKCFSQGDVRCLSPEVIASVKKTVSFSDEVFEKPTRLLIQGKTKNISLENPEVLNPEEPNLDVSKAEVAKPEVNDRETKMTPDEEKLSSQNDKDSNLYNSFGVIIQNGLEVKEPVTDVPETPPNERSTKGGPIRETNSNMIAQIKEVTRCSCHVEGCHCRDITRPTRAVISQAKAAKEQGSTLHGKLLKQRPSRPSSAPIKHDVPHPPQTVSTPPRSRITSAQHKRSGSEGSRRVRPVSAHIKRPSAKETRRVRGQAERIHAPIPPDPRLKRKKENKKEQSEIKDVGFVWGPGEDDVAASEECEQVYAKFKEKGINISMQTVKRGLMAPARRASENCMASFSMSSSSGLLSRPETWLPEEYARVKIWDDVLKKGR